MKSGRLSGPERRAQILEVAQTVFADMGFDGATMSDIAAAAAVTKPVLYQHFESKHDLYSTLLSTLADKILESVLSATFTATKPRDQAEQGVSAYLKVLREDDRAFRILFDGANRRHPEWTAEAKKVRSTMANGVASLLDIDSLSRPQRLNTAIGIMAMVEAMSHAAWADSEDVDPDQLAFEITELLWSGLRNLGHATWPPWE